LVDEQFIEGIVCDGCTGTHSTLKRNASNNEIGAKLTVYSLLSLLSSNQAPEIADNDNFIEELSKALIEKLNSLLNIFCEDSNEKSVFTADFLMSTILGFVVTQDKYIVFHAGDGLIILNGEMTFLENHAGSYLGEALIENTQNHRHLTIFASGKTDELKNIFLATDGFHGVLNAYQDIFMQFIQLCPIRNNGFDPSLIRIFRKETIWHKRIKENILHNEWFKDDASFVLLRRVKGGV
jgi:hypothetical protein